MCCTGYSIYIIWLFNGDREQWWSWNLSAERSADLFAELVWFLEDKKNLLLIMWDACDDREKIHTQRILRNKKPKKERQFPFLNLDKYEILRDFTLSIQAENANFV